MTLALPEKNDPSAASGTMPNRFTEGTIPAIFQSWSSAPITVSGLAGHNEGSCALTPVLTACSGSPTGMTGLSSAETKIQWSLNLTANSFRYLGRKKF